jgi:hypothetical protein
LTFITCEMHEWISGMLLLFWNAEFLGLRGLGVLTSICTWFRDALYVAVEQVDASERDAVRQRLLLAWRTC